MMCIWITKILSSLYSDEATASKQGRLLLVHLMDRKLVRAFNL